MQAKNHCFTVSFESAKCLSPMVIMSFVVHVQKGHSGFLTGLTTNNINDNILDWVTTIGTLFIAPGQQR